MRVVRLETGPWTVIAAHAAEDTTVEACGLLIGVADDDVARVMRVVSCPNVADPPQRARRFQIDPRIVIEQNRALRGSPETLLGFYHSHPDGGAEPSPTDRFYIALWPDTVWLIVPVSGNCVGEPRAWWLDAGVAPVPSAAGEDVPAPRELMLERVG